MERPSTRGLSAVHRRAVRAAAERLAGGGWRAWIVGGAVRDLARGVTPKDVDLVSAAPPEAVEELFERTVGVGRAFGIVRVLLDGAALEVATFRSERGYADARRPDEVRYGASVEEDAARRDFTCNALYLDPATDELADPTGGLADLEAGVLRCVGDPAERFREDGLRLLRMARFEASLDLTLAPGTIEAARSAADSLRGVSAERVFEELSRILAGPRAARALRTLASADLLARSMPAWAEASVLPQADRLAAFAHLGEAPGALAGWALLLESDPSGPACAARRERDLEIAAELRMPRSHLRALDEIWSLRRRLAELARPVAPRSARIRALRGERWRDALRVGRAWELHAGRDPGPLDELERWRAALSEAELRPAPLVVAADLGALRVPRGPLWGRLLEEAEELRLDGHLAGREEALEWLARRARALRRE